MGPVGAMGLTPHFLLAFAITVEVKIHTNGSHPRQCGEPFLLVRARARLPMSVGADDKGIFPHILPPPFRLFRGGRHIDGSEHVLPGGQLDADVLHGVTVVLSHFGEHGTSVHTGVEESIDAEPHPHFAPQTVAASLPSRAVGIERGKIVEHLRAFFCVAAGIFVGFDLIATVGLSPPFKVEIGTDVRQRFLQ